MRLLTWNINGLRAVLKRKYGTVKALLEDLGADIICFQETKLTKADFDRELALVEGWDSFFSINRGRSAYSGTATFCRRGIADAVAAQEGVTGILHTTGEKAACNDLLETGFCDAAATTWQRYSREEAELIDAEGRCVVSDHQAFILFNLYGPAISSEENAADRFAYKLQFYKALGTRIAALRSRGRRIVVVGDLNISPDHIDSCEPAPDFLVREDRVWLRNLMTLQGGPFLDVFRLHHPAREQAYTCWSQASSARVNNWGTRIDLILAADGEGSQGNAADEMDVNRLFAASDIWPELTGSDHCPAWADLDFRKPLPMQETVPAFSTRNIFTGRQNKLTGWLQSASTKARSLPLASVSLVQKSQTIERPAEQAGISRRETPMKKVNSLPTRPLKRAAGPLQSSLTRFVKRQKPDEKSKYVAGSQGHAPELVQESGSSLDSFRGELRADKGNQSCEGNPVSIPAAFGRSLIDNQRPDQSNGMKSGSGIKEGMTKQPMNDPPDLDTLIEDSQREAERCEEAARQEAEEVGAFTRLLRPKIGSSTSFSDAASAWKQIQERMKPPKCKGHNEDCVIRQVKKKGPNFGRLFYVCRRPDGAPPQGRCDFFVWSGSREVRGISKAK